jgi:uncharacterized hydrophobic protein (TIGR00271 family)
VLHLRIVAPPDRAEQALEMLCELPGVTNVIHLRGAALRPPGDVILCDVAREDASVILSDLRQLDIVEEGSIAIEEVDTHLSRLADQAVRDARGAPGDAVVWEEVVSKTSEEAELTATFVLFMVLAGLIATVGIFLNSPILIIGAMVVGPEFGPIAGICVALVQRRPEIALRSGTALAVGFPVAISAALLASLAFRWTGVTPDEFSAADHELSTIIASPDFFAFFIAFCAGVAGMLSLSTAKSGAIVGVLISVTTIPAAANIGVSAAYGDWDACRGSAEQLTVNVASILVAGVLTLGIQRWLYERRRRRHLDHPSRALAGLPLRRGRRPGRRERERLGR